MKYAYMDKLHSMKIGEAPMPEPTDGFVRVKIQSCGICGSDVHYYKDGRCGECITPDNFILGHEVAGIVEKLGPGVTGLKVGDRVALEPGYTCGKCEYCKKGLYNLCPDVIFFATPPVQGALQEYVCHPADMCFKLPDNVSFEEGALVEPLCVGMHAANLAQIALGSSAVIIGSGCIGLMTMMAVKASGAAKVIVVDRFQNRIDKAKELGAHYVINASEEDVAARIDELTDGQGADFVFECAGSTVTARQTPEYTKRGGTIVLVGMPPEPEFPFNFSRCQNREITIKNTFRYRNLYPAGISAISGGLIDVKPMISHRFTFAESEKAFNTVIEDAKNVVKGVINF